MWLVMRASCAVHLGQHLGGFLAAPEPGGCRPQCSAGGSPDLLDDRCQARGCGHRVGALPARPGGQWLTPSGVEASLVEQAACEVTGSAESLVTFDGIGKPAARFVNPSRHLVEA